MPRASTTRAWLLVVLLATVPLAGCTQPAPPTTPDGNDTTNGTGDPPDHTELPKLPRPDAALLMGLVTDQVHRDGDPMDPRYRTPGTEGHAEAIPLLRGMLEARNLTVEEQTFRAELPNLGEVELTNLYGTRQGTSEKEIWLAAHWDSRAWADGHTRDTCQGPPVLGANDGAAGVAVVVHLLDLLPATDHTIKVALFDGEDQGCGPTGWAVGSQHAADALTGPERRNITALLLVDMPGDKHLEIRREGYSRSYEPELVDLVFDTADRLGADRFIDEDGPSILDDHKPFLDKGVAAVDVIHLDDEQGVGERGPFPSTHHTLNDTPANLSGENMAQVTEVVGTTLLRIDRGEFG